MNPAKYSTILMLMYRSEHKHDGRDRIHTYLSSDKIAPFVKLLSYLQQHFDSQAEMLSHVDISKDTYQRVMQQTMSYKTGRKILNAYLDIKLETVRRRQL